jgi:hypothetical protein
VPIGRNGDEAATERLKLVTGPFILRRLKTDRSIIADLPDKLEMKVWCNLTPEQASLYQATVTDMLARIEAAEGIERRGLVLATMAKLKQVCNHPAHLLGDGSRLPGRSGKLARLEEICDEVVAGGERALCFTQYAEFGRMLQPHLAARLGCPVFWLHGGTPKKQRDAMVDRFSRSTQPAGVLLSLKAGGTGLNLTAASHVIHVDRWWNPAVEDQATRTGPSASASAATCRSASSSASARSREDRRDDRGEGGGRIVGTGESWLTERPSPTCARSSPRAGSGVRVSRPASGGRSQPGGRWPPGGWPEPSRPRPVTGGIQARSKRGSIGERWWSRRFIDVLESFCTTGRLSRGRNYARRGQVLWLTVRSGYVDASVQGSRENPYHVRIQVLPLTTAQWQRVIGALAAQAVFRARLLAGEMPAEIEEVFAGCGTPLFPRGWRDLEMSCSCPDCEVPCKHLAAVCYVLAERFDEDPFDVLAWRGKGWTSCWARCAAGDGGGGSRTRRTGWPRWPGGGPAAG